MRAPPLGEESEKRSTNLARYDQRKEDNPNYTGRRVERTPWFWQTKWH